MVVQDLYEGFNPGEHSNVNEYFQNYEVYVGDDPNYELNSDWKCPGGPFMKTDDSLNYDTVTYT